MLCEVTERPRRTPTSGASMSVASFVREHTPLTSDASWVLLGVATPVDSSLKVGRGRHYPKNLHWRRRQKELHQTVRTLGICPPAKPHDPRLHDDQPHLSSRHHDELILDSLEEGQFP